MFFRRLRFVLIVCMLPPLAGACALPGLTPETIPTTSGGEIATIIAATYAAAATGTQAALPPTPTFTLTPSATPFPTGTPTPAFSSEGTALITNPDGTTSFVDQTGGYRLLIPSGWLLVRVNEQEFLEAWTLAEAADPRIQNFLRQVQKSDPAAFRLFGVDTALERAPGGFVSNFSVFWDRSSTDSLADILETLEVVLPQSSLSASILSSQVDFTSGAVPVGVIESSSRLLSPEGWPVHVYQKQVIFQLQTGALTIVLSTTDEMKDVYLPAFNTMADGINIPLP